MQYVSRASQKRVVSVRVNDGQLLVYRDTIPSVANSVTNILALWEIVVSVRRRMEPETRRRCLALLHWEEKSLEQVEGEMISRVGSAARWDVDERHPPRHDQPKETETMVCLLRKHSIDVLDESCPLIPEPRQPSPQHASRACRSCERRNEPVSSP